MLIDGLLELLEWYNFNILSFKNYYMKNIILKLKKMCDFIDKFIILFKITNKHMTIFKIYSNHIYF